ncbi:MAG: reverse transcriptase family protein [Myxococcaceae bacterium]
MALGFWDKFKSAFTSAPPLDVDVRNAMLARCARKESFTALDIANDVTGNNPNRSVDDIKAVTLSVDRLHEQKLLEPFGYTRDASFRFNPPQQQQQQQQAPPPVAPKPPAPGQVQVVNQIGVSPPRVGDSPDVTRTLDAAVAAKACALQDGPARWDLKLEGRAYSITITRPGQSPQRTTSSFATEQQAIDGFKRAIRDALARGLKVATGAAPPPASNVSQLRSVQQQPPPPAAPAAPKPPVPTRVDPFKVNAELLGLSKEELRQRALKIDPYRTAWIGRVDTIPPQSDERTALIDRGLMLRGFLDAQQLKEIHEAGDLWIRYHDAAQLAHATAAKTADEAVQKQREEALKKREAKRAAAAERKRVRAEEVARRKAEDVIFLGPGVSSGLADRRTNVEKLQKLSLPVLSTPKELADAMGIPVPRLRWLCFHSDATEKTHYKYFEVKKRSGGTRLLAAPMPALKKAQRWVLDNILSKLPVTDAAHGFVPGRSTATNARAHLGRNLVVSFDLKDFFPTIRFKRVRSIFKELGYSPAIATHLALLCTEAPRRKVEYDGRVLWVASGERALPQGAPTSPALSNQAALLFDKRIKARTAKRGWTYTRYADDLTFSGESLKRENIGWLHAAVRHTAEDEGFALNPKKGRIMGDARRQQVTGLVVNDKLGVPRELVRKVRAILHQAKKTGLAAQNREQRPDFNRWLRGTIAYISMADPAKGQKLLEQLKALGG